MTHNNLVLVDRRAALGGFGAALLIPAFPGMAQTRNALTLEAVAGTVTLKPGQTPTPIWQLVGGPNAEPLRFERGETVDVTLTNRLPIPVALNWMGLDGMPLAEPLTSRPPIAPDNSATYSLTFRHAGTMLADLVVIGDGTLARPATARPVIISETEPLAIDRDEVLLFQDWRLKPDGSAISPGAEPGDAAALLTVNGGQKWEIIADQNHRLRLRLINSSQSTVIAVKISDYDVRIMAIDGQPSEPFIARDGVMVLTPGARVDAFIDVVKPAGAVSAIMLLDGREARQIGRLITSDAAPAPVRPAPLPVAVALPSNGLATQLDLKSALRVDLPLGTPDWETAVNVTRAMPPAFKVKRGRTVVLTLANRGPKPALFHLHGHHFRLLDRLDDGWKPFWLDTLAIDVGQTQRIAFAAEFSGLYPMQAKAADWTAPRLVRSYLVE